MGLVKRNNTWWMSFTFQGRQVRRSTETSDKKLAEAILSKVRVQIVEGKYFEKPKEDPYTFSQLMDRYLKEHASRRAHYRRYVNMATNVKTFFGNPKLSQITPKTIVAFKAKRYADGVMPATINRELAMLKKPSTWPVANGNGPRTIRSVGCRWRRSRTHGTAGLPNRRKHGCSWLRRLDSGSRHLRRQYRHATGRNSCPYMGRGRLHRRTVTVFKSKNGERRTIPVNQTVLELLSHKYEQSRGLRGIETAGCVLQRSRYRVGWQQPPTRIYRSPEGGTD
jgi:hypothetical protein